MVGRILLLGSDINNICHLVQHDLVSGHPMCAASAHIACFSSISDCSTACKVPIPVPIDSDQLCGVLWWYRNETFAAKNRDLVSGQRFVPKYIHC